MTIGPAPMIRIEEMSVRLGMSLGDIWARARHKKRARCLRVLRAAQRCVPARGRSLDQNQRAGKGGRKITGKTGAGGTTRAAHARRAIKVMRAWLWPILAAARRAENPVAASLASMAASPWRESPRSKRRRQ